MLSRFEIGRLQVRIRGPVAKADAARARLAEVGARLLPAALDRELAGLDDGTSLVIVRRVEAQLPLIDGESDEACATRWAQRMSGSVRALLPELTSANAARSVETDAAIAFADPLALLAELVIDVVNGRLSRWCWQPEAGALPAAQHALSMVPDGAGAGRAYAATEAPPFPLTPIRAVSWALGCAGGALPALVRALHAEGVAADALTLLSGAEAERLVNTLFGVPLAAAADHAALASMPPLATFATLAASIERWPGARPADPRNVLLLLALASEAQPALRGAPGLTAAAVRSLVERARQLAAPAAQPDSRRSPTSAEESADLVHNRDTRVLSPTSAMPAPRAYVERAPTGYGGLLFLIPVVLDLEIVSGIVDELTLATEPGLSAVLYRLACLLSPEGWADRTLLWFSGLDEPVAPTQPLSPEQAAAVMRAGQRVAKAARERPAAEHPADLQYLRSSRAALPSSLSVAPWFDELCLHFAARLTAALRARVALELPPEVLLTRLIRKAGTLVRSTTQLHLELPLEAADLDVRRALLDLDPGWVPFLGRVVTFSYA